MSIIEIWLLAVSLAIDCFTVSVAGGVILRKVEWKTFLKTGFFFGLFQAMMPFFGWLAAKGFHRYIEAYDHWIAFGLLTFLGARMIKEHFSGGESESFSPRKLKVILTLAVATSIDALAVGISFAFTGFSALRSLAYPLTAIGLTSFALSVAGNLIGAFFGKRFHPRMEIFGGLVLIGIGVKILVEHLS